MENLIYNIGQVLGIAIIHSLWQGLLIWFLLRLLLAGNPNLNPVYKHNIAGIAMLALAAWFLVTLFNEASAFSWSPVKGNQSVISFTPHFSNGMIFMKKQADQYYYTIAAYLPYISILYIAGLLTNLLKLSYCRLKLYRIKKALLPAGDLQWQVDDFSIKLNLKTYVQVYFSRLVNVPCMMGYLNPIILLPVSLATGLSAAEIETILLHELAHIKRNDYLMNLLQQIITSLLFFNPFAQLIGRLIGAERENCCDDIVVQITCNPLVYAHALLKLEESRRAHLTLALAASTKKHFLLNRIERIMKTKQTMGNMRHLLVAILLLAGSLSSIAWLNPQIKNGKVIVKGVKPAELITKLFADTIRKKTIKANAAKPAKWVKSKTKSSVYDDSSYNNIDDPELDKLSAEVQKHADVVSSYYQRPEFNKQIELITQKSKAIEDYYNRPDIRKLHDEKELIGKKFEKNSPEIERLSKQMQESGNQMGKYYNSAAFANLVARMEKKYNIPHKRYLVSRDSADWSGSYKNFQEDITRNIPADVRFNQQKLTELSKKMSSMYNTSEFKELNKKMIALNDSLISANANANIRQQQIELGQMSAKMNALQNNAQMKREQKLLQEASKKLNAYMNSPEFKKRQQQILKTQRIDQWDVNNKDIKEHPEQPEQPEQPEVPEKPETPKNP